MRGIFVRAFYLLYQAADLFDTQYKDNMPRKHESNGERTKENIFQGGKYK